MNAKWMRAKWLRAKWLRSKWSEPNTRDKHQLLLQVVCSLDSPECMLTRECTICEHKSPILPLMSTLEKLAFFWWSLSPSPDRKFKSTQCVKVKRGFLNILRGKILFVAMHFYFIQKCEDLKDVLSSFMKMLNT
jgi:hypothetical protein